MTTALANSDRRHCIHCGVLLERSGTNGPWRDAIGATVCLHATTTHAIETPPAGCKSCDTDVIWTVTQANGRWLLVDAKPAAGGTVRLIATEHGGPPLATIVSRDLAFGRTDLYLAHFVNCPAADVHRKPRGRTTRRDPL